jgi:hypothetical protein
MSRRKAKTDSPAARAAAVIIKRGSTWVCMGKSLGGRGLSHILNKPTE